MGERALVIIPTYNERENITRIIGAILEQDDRLEILVADDGSPDGTGEIVDSIMQHESRLHIIKPPRKLGIGTAYIAGSSYALKNCNDLVLETDAVFVHDTAAF